MLILCLLYKFCKCFLPLSLFFILVYGVLGDHEPKVMRELLEEVKHSLRRESYCWR